MIQIRHSIEERKKELDMLIAELEKRNKKYPEGALRISKVGKNTTYYYSNKENSQSNVSRKYISKTNMGLVQQLAQKQYEEEILKRAYRDRKKLEKMLIGYEDGMEEIVFESLSDVRKSIVDPIVVPQKQYIQEWEGVSYKGKVIQPNEVSYTSEKGEIVRSKSEKILADKFYKYGIPYRYEYPIYLKGYGVIYPDFMLLNVRTRKEYYWEHFGMMGDPEYGEKAVKKTNLYIENGIYPGVQLLITYETKNYVDYDMADRIIQKFLL